MVFVIVVVVAIAVLITGIVLAIKDLVEGSPTPVAIAIQIGIYGSLIIFWSFQLLKTI
jgi:hypothetical protein